MMLESDLPELAIAGDRGIDLFRRVEDADQRRVQYECIATAYPAPPESERRLDVFIAPACRQPDRLWQAVTRYQNAPALHQAFAFGHPHGYPSMRDPATRLALFQCLEFFRTRLVADLSIAGYEEKLAKDPEHTARHFSETTGALKQLLDYNMLVRARPIRETLAPLVIARVRVPGFTEDGDQATGYSLRLLGDLCLRDGAPADALACFEASIAAADNPFRRRKAIEAAQATGENDTILAHIDSFARAGRIPPDLDALRQSLAPS